MDYLPGRVCCLLKLYEHSSKTLVKGLKTDETEVLMKTLDIQVSIHQENDSCTMEAGSGDKAGDSIEPESWWARQKKEATSFTIEDCAECRYVAGIGMYATALYVAYTGVTRQKRLGKNLWGAVPALVVSGAMFGMGTARLLRINPFSHSGNETGIDIVDQYLRKLSQPQDKRDNGDNVER